jgi:hypothetical protein
LAVSPAAAARLHKSPLFVLHRALLI